MIEILDTTLRDGAQSANISYSVMDKLDIITELDKLGISFLEIANPSANIKDRELSLLDITPQISKTVCFGATRKKNLRIEDDEAFSMLIDSHSTFVTIFGKTSPRLVMTLLNTDLAENLAMIADSVSYAVTNKKEVIYDAEHFFEAWEENKEYAFLCLSTALENGATRLVLCDTNGGYSPKTISLATQSVVSRFPNAIIGIHCHNDNGLAIANTLSAIEAGATHVQGTMLGYGERAGNAKLSSIIPFLQLKLNYDILSSERLRLLTPVCQSVAEITNIMIPDNEPYVGSGAFAHKAGMHIDGISKDYSFFEHIDPTLVGNVRHILISDISGKSAMLTKLKDKYPYLDKNDIILDNLLKQLKEQEAKGYQYESAEASFLLLAEKIIHRYTPPFKVLDYKITNNYLSSATTCNISIEVNQISKSASAIGNGPVHALDLAMRECLQGFFESVIKINLIDYKVRVINPKGATGAMVRVLITTTNGKKIIKTVGVSEDIILASYIALSDSYETFIYNP